MSKLKLMKREDLEKVFEPWENIFHRDVEVGGSSKVNFELDSADNVPDVPHVSINGEKFPMTTEALAETSRAVQFPVPYANRCPSEVLFYNLHYLFSGGASGKARFFLKNNKVVGCREGQPNYQTNLQILENVEKAISLEEILGYSQSTISMQKSGFSVVVNRSFEPVSGDSLFGGIDIFNSISGDYAVEIAPFIFRQVCSNGMIVSEHVGRFTRSKDEEFSVWAQNSAKSALEKIDGEFGRIGKMVEIGIEGDPTSTLRSLFRKFNIPVRTQEEIVGEALVMNNGDGPRTMYDLWNSITRVATHSSKLSFMSSRGLKMVASDMTKLISLCPTCHQLCEN